MTTADTDALYATATAAELASNFDYAFSLYLRAAQAYLHHSRTLSAGHERERDCCKANANKCLDRAERIKATRKGSLRPRTRDPFSKEEQTYVLDKSAKVHDLRFSVWEEGSERTIGDDVDAQPPLGPVLLAKCPVWRRPGDMHPADKLSLAAPMLQPHHIQQNVVTDCSVCSAAAICLHHHRTFGSKLGLSCIFPHDVSGMPVLAPDGRYALRLFVNGAFRKVSVDDLLPFYADGRSISASTAPSFGGFDLWPCLLEKAYMKLMGGYNFPGSNSSIDVHTLTGWLPEHIEIRSSSFVREKVWARILSGFHQGACILTFGTGSRDGALSVHCLNGKRTELLPTHSYAVLGVHEDPDERWVTILNPWIASADFYSEVTTGLRTLEVEDHEQVEDVGTGPESEASLIDVSWDDVCAVFDGIYLNWDPALFGHRIEFHGMWRQKSDGNSNSQCVHYHLTLGISPSAGTDRDYAKRKDQEEQEEHEIWVALTRHIVDKRREGEFIAVHAVELEHGETGIGLDLSLKGTYTSSTHALARLTHRGSSAQFALVASYDGAYVDVCFTVQAFSRRLPLAWVVQPGKGAHEQVIEGTLSARSAGGNSTYPTFMNNPQYRLRLSADQGHSFSSTQGTFSQGMGKVPKSSVRLIVEGPRNVPLNVMLVWRGNGQSGERVAQLGPGDIVASSGAYSYGVAQAAASVAPGDYCIIVSAFEPCHRGPFTLRAESTAHMDIDAIPAEGAGMFCKMVKDAWTPGLDGGSPRSGQYDKNPSFIIDVRMATPLKIRLQLTKPSSSIALNVTLFALASPSSTPSLHSFPPTSGANVSPRPNLALGRQIASSGAYADGSSSPAGAVTPQVRVAPGRYIAVASTFDSGVHAEFQLLVFAKTDVRVASVR